ncbi:hypothetical protein D8B26_000133 [Coccidioides posadasii str. Silveira]|uniref:Zn(2)-C6 fungal-type domain-containing protein n=2 Tax=Coccidioides posadasii TaxID=199306 RepID=E9D7P5_COCPS|nr:Fungal specific transcription factor, putative [Coccidioides posadasii C735 delta SOWgp]EER25556.1 Fungal specific transcription factor, putative [Coccidioides posadasii C735 delta SOWgp]EFW17404.1 conserved hypothetical protein [Coccidioides posadasii str. Silveira]QVM05422.1 hypothetical protein D8B26_000133 [Coccidioides posadasii str. Silveira]|eukprot:XP_003067701.1 Fungal specific transcription factor, putative [Coccidioides posadasii C735 delta SOWgp]
MVDEQEVVVKACRGVSEPPRKKRKRRTLACLPCRNRKVKCDFGQPSCERCLKTAWPERCTYENRPPAFHADDGPSAPPRPEVPLVAPEPDQVEGRNLKTLEYLVQCLAQQSAHSFPTHTNPSRAPSPRVNFHGADPGESPVSKRPTTPATIFNATLHGRETKTRFHGCSNIYSLYPEFPELKQYLHRLKYEHPVLAGFLRDLSKLKEGRLKKQTLPGELALDTNYLSGLLPQWSVIESCMGIYFNSFGSVSRLFHRPMFNQQLQLIRDRPQSAPPVFIAQVFLILAIVWNGHPDGSITPSTVSNWIRWADTWLQHCGIKRPTLATLQVRCLLVQAREVNHTQRNQAWAATGNVVKLAMSAGFHREQPPGCRISIFNREMRRRVWATILELDLQASLDRGMPPTVQHADYDCLPPLNINDEDIQESTAEIPIQKPLSIPTDSSYQVMAAKSLGLRLHICSLINSPRLSISSSQVLELDEAIYQQLSSIPGWKGVGDSDVNANQRILLWRTLLQIQLQRSQLSLHSSCILGDSKAGTFAHSSRSRLDVAVSILCHEQLLLDQLGRRAWFTLSEVIMQSAVTICHYLYTSDSGVGSSIVRQILPSLTQTLVSLTERVLPWWEEKFTAVQKGMREYFILCVIISMVKGKLWPESIDAYRKESIDRMTTLCYNTLSKHMGRSKLDISEKNWTHPIESPIAAPPTDSNYPPSNDSLDITFFEDWDTILGDFTTEFSDFGAL